MTDMFFEDRMRTNPYQTYVEDEIMTADPVKLIQLLYRHASEAVAEARAKLAEGDIRGRSAAISKAIEILAELSFALDHQKGGELSARLAALYDYMQRRLVEANQQQTDAPLAEVARILQTLNEAWCAMEVPEGVMPAAASRVPMNNASPGGMGGRGTVYSGYDEYAAGQMPPADYVPLSCAY